MLLYAALVPPREILDDLWSVVVPVDDAAPEDVTPAKRRAGRRRRAKSGAVARPEPALDLAPVAQVHLLICKFGNLALHDANRVAEALTESATEWSSPRLRLRGFSTLESEEDPSVWVDIEGDLDALTVVGRGVQEVAKRLSLFVDRRLFQPRVRLGSVRRDATEAELEAVLAKLARFETNAWWQTGITLLTPVDQGPDQPSFRTFADVPLGPHVVH